MVRVFNAKDIDGHRVSLEIAGEKLVSAPARSDGEPEFTFGFSVLKISEVADFAALKSDVAVDAEGLTLLPAGLDVHIHSRDPGLTQKEDWHSVARSAWKGGVTAVCDMPNTLPPTMTKEAVLAKAEIALGVDVDFRLLVGVGASNIARVAELLTDPSLPVCALKVFYGKTTGELMYDDLETLGRSLPEDGSKVIVFHSEDQCTVDCNQGRLKDKLRLKDNAAFAVHSEVRSSVAAHASTKVILEWARTSYKRPIHIAHISTPVEVEMLAEARQRGVPVTGEVAPHHLLFSTDDYARLGPLVKMNPPLRTRGEVEALRRLVGQGAVEIYATDHAPHLLKEKYVDVEHSPSGVPSLEYFYPLLFEVARVTGLPLAKAVAMATSRPAEVFGFKDLGSLKAGGRADFVLLARDPTRVNGEEVVSKCGWTPYDGWTLPCAVKSTFRRGRRMDWRR